MWLSETFTRAACTAIISVCLLALAAVLVVVVAGAHGGDQNLPTWRLLIFAPASLMFMLLGAVMVAFRMLFLTLAVALLCLAAAVFGRARDQWRTSTAVLAGLAAISHLSFLLYICPRR